MEVCEDCMRQCSLSIKHSSRNIPRSQYIAMRESSRMMAVLEKKDMIYLRENRVNKPLAYADTHD